MMSHPQEIELLNYATGRMVDKEELEIEAHIARCEDCLWQVRGIRLLRKEFDSILELTTPGNYESLVDRLQEVRKTAEGAIASSEYFSKLQHRIQGCDSATDSILDKLTAGRDEHIAALAKLIVPQDKQWLLPSLLEHIKRTPNIEDPIQEPVAELRTAAFTNSAPDVDLWFRLLVHIPRLVTELEGALAEYPDLDQIEEAAMRHLIKKCLDKTPLANELPPESISKISEYYMETLTYIL